MSRLTTDRSTEGEVSFSRFYRIFFILFLSFTLSMPATLQAQRTEPNSEAVETSGDIILLALPASAALSSVVMKDKKGFWQFTKSFATNIAITGALKYTINKRRPFNEGGQAFPSGHTSITFQAASFIHRRYGFKYSIPGYLLAGWTGYSRIYATRHDGYDVLAGAVVGIGSSFLFTTPYQREHMQLSFKSSEDEFLLGFIYRF
ncbi:phosphatase PAP2 family protein [Salinimicrobium sediminilitoris]|uniref:phosphatase PAP2 family protein n=1 Tax=Salinimicrobium sediminilitoris TaxID=2876715 RepID=UPI001E30EDF3|nr:phosphatase PAP2 family protein [Salinimicrobium sediminilitoris]MCC8360073.1 phosphatase PAP2 family protein [Salinimicrobium sediminilitoris]